jgi:hypothetical protein
MKKSGNCASLVQSRSRGEIEHVHPTKITVCSFSNRTLDRIGDRRRSGSAKGAQQDLSFHR